jgi:hypothetical protein
MLTLVRKAVITTGPYEMHLFFPNLTVIKIFRQLLEKGYRINDLPAHLSGRSRSV